MSRRAPEDRGAVITLHKQGLTPAEICRKTGFDHRFVKRWIAKHNDSGSLDDAKRAGRPRKLSKGVEGCGVDCGKKNAEKKTPLESSNREGAEETEGLRCELHDRTENSASSRFTCF